MAKSLDEMYAADAAAPASAEPAASAANDTGVKSQEPAAAPAAKAAETPPVSQPKDDNPTVPRAALDDERRKRKDLEARLYALEKSQRPQQTQQRERPDAVLDPDGFLAELDVREFNRTLALTEEILVEKVGEDSYKAAETAVLELAAANPQFAQEFGQAVASARNPARHTYDIGTQIIERKAANDPAAQREKLKAEILAELGHAPAAHPGQVPQVQSQRSKPNVPVSMASVQSAGPRNAGNRPVRRRTLDELYT